MGPVDARHDFNGKISETQMQGFNIYLPNARVSSTPFEFKLIPNPEIMTGIPIITPQKSNEWIAKIAHVLKGLVTLAKAHHFGPKNAVSLEECNGYIKPY